MSGLDAELKIRLEQATKTALEQLAGRTDRTPAAIARRAIRELLIREGELEEAVTRA